MINCREAVERLWSYLDRNLGRVEERELEAHLGLCRHCCGELEFARQVRGLLAKPGVAVEIPPEARVKLDAFLKRLGESHE
ncbi:MAG: zf-HC2 domain-containing protein [Armatimonadota bacterium]|nr:zf-HC2 domain-containing protein [Armatimonadota bacterium]